jgi:hypothetical protein
LVVGLAHGSDHLVDTEAKEALSARAGEFVRRFAQVNGAIRCRDLIDLDVSTAAGIEAYRARNLTEELCAGIVRNATQAILELMAEWELEER